MKRYVFLKREDHFDWFCSMSLFLWYSASDFTQTGRKFFTAFCSDNYSQFEDDVLTKSRGLRSRADDYINKPPNPSELRARIEAVSGTAQTMMVENPHVEYSDLIVDIDKMTVEILLKNITRETVDLTPYEFKFYACYSRGPDRYIAAK